MIINFKNSPEPSLAEIIILFLKMELIEIGIILKVYDNNNGIDKRKLIILLTFIVFLLFISSPILIASAIYIFKNMSFLLEYINFDRIWFNNPKYERLSELKSDDVYMILGYMYLISMPFLALSIAKIVGFIRRITSYLNK